MRFASRHPATVVFGLLLLLAPFASAVELTVADFNDQGLFNNFSGDSGPFSSGRAVINASFDTGVVHGQHGASLRIDYSVPAGFCGMWHSLLAKASYAQHSLNFTNLYGGLLNSTGNPTRVENVSVTNFSFWARGNGDSNFTHQVKVEFKNVQGVIGHNVFEIPNSTNWARYNFAIERLAPADLSRMKELVFVIEDWRNERRSGTLYIDDINFETDEPPADPTAWSDDAMLDAVSQRAFAYFLRFTDDLGFALDRSTYSDIVSVGTIGFQLAAYCIGHQRGWADRSQLEQRVTQVLQNLAAIPMGPEVGTERGGYRGFYYHFLTANTGLRKDTNVELSVYDTMLLMYGVLACKEYFPDNAAIQSAAQLLFERVEWDWLVDRSAGRNRDRFHLAWVPGPGPKGTFVRHIDGQTDEALMVDVLALGARQHSVSEKTHLARNRVFASYDGSAPIMASWGGSLFNYFFASCWFDLQPRGFDLHPEHPTNIWQNNLLAILANRQFCIDHACSTPAREGDCFATYGPQAWGLTACDNLVPPGAPSSSEYFGFGALPTEENVRFATKAQHAGTLAVYGAASCINFTPAESIAALRHCFEIPNLWSPLWGFGDAYSLDPHSMGAPYDSQGNATLRFASHLNGPWVNPMMMGVNLGPMLLAIENHRSRFFWKLAEKTPEIRRGLDRIFGVASLQPRVQIESKSQGRTVVSLEWPAAGNAVRYSIFSSKNGTDWRLAQGGVKGTNWTTTELGEADRFFRIKALKR